MTKCSLDVPAFWQSVLEQDADALRSWFSPDAVIRWICSNELFTVDEYIRANCEYPGKWHGYVERIVRADDQIITACCVRPDDDSASYHVVSFIRMNGKQIISMDEYWSDDLPPPEWRKNMNIGTETQITH